MPLQLSEFTDLPLLFIILEPCHYNFKILRNMPLHTPSTCFSKFMDQNTPSLLLPLIPSLFPLSLHCRIPPRSPSPLPRRSSSGTACPRDGTVEPLHRRRPPSRLPTFLPGAPARWPRGADGGLARARARRAAAGGRAQLRRPGSRWPANRGAEPRGGRDSAASLRPLPLSPPRRPPMAARRDPPRAGGGPRGGAGAPPPPLSALHRRPSSPSPLVVGMAAGELGVATPRRPANARRRPVARAADAPRWRSAEEFVAVGICLREREERGRG